MNATWRQSLYVFQSHTIYICSSQVSKGTIIAQVALTSLGLPSLSQSHWVARASLLLSLVSGCLAVFYASLLQRTLGNLRTSSHVKSWWRGSQHLGDSEFHWSYEESAFRRFRRESETWRRGSVTAPGERRYSNDMARRGWVEYMQRIGAESGLTQAKLLSSVAAAVLMSAPTMMINFALGAFLTGVGIYFGFVWKKNLDALATRAESRNVFVCFIVSLAFCSSFYLIPYLLKIWEDRLKTRHRLRPWMVFQALEDAFSDGGPLRSNVERQNILERDVKDVLDLMGRRLQDDWVWKEAYEKTQSIMKRIEGWDNEDRQQLKPTM